MNPPSGASSGSDTGASQSAESTGLEDPFGLEPFGGGSRLLARVLEVPGGARRVQAFHDQQLGIDCRIFDTPQGLHCLPTTEDLGIASADGPLLFADSECTIPALKVPAGYPVPSITSLRPGDLLTTPFPGRCPGLPHRATVHRLVREVSTAYRGEDCESASSPDDRVYSLEEVDLSMFVAGQLVDADGIRRLVTDDGAWHNAYPLDDAGQPCNVGWVDGETMCSPLRMPLAGLTDMTCHEGSAGTCDGQRVASSVDIPDYCDHDPPFAFSYTDDPWAHLYYPVVGVTESAECSVGGECGPAEDRATFSGPPLLVGEPVLDPGFPAVEVFELGEGPVVADWIRRFPGDPPSGFGMPSELDGFFDTRLGSDCYPEAVDDEWWCLHPLTVWVDEWVNFSDSNCQHPVHAVNRNVSTLMLTGEAAVEGAGLHGHSYWTVDILENETVYEMFYGECRVDPVTHGSSFARPVAELAIEPIRITEHLE
ncbi:MAG: hypothetical protein AAF799_27540 [Myxococcota bacterium]